VFIGRQVISAARRLGSFVSRTFRRQPQIEVGPLPNPANGVSAAEGAIDTPLELEFHGPEFRTQQAPNGSNIPDAGPGVVNASVTVPAGEHPRGLGFNRQNQFLNGRGELDSAFAGRDAALERQVALTVGTAITASVALGASVARFGVARTINALGTADSALNIADIAFGEGFTQSNTANLGLDVLAESLSRGNIQANAFLTLQNFLITLPLNAANSD